MSAKEIAYELISTDSYYSTVAFGFVEEAVTQAAREHGTFKNIEELNKYIKANLI
ncbi:MAG: hypothetical protein Q4E99_05945 [Bacillota bacterium]|nr:hypothetical protein [Bacillota bacterium]